jgi:tetratricopeptide (TPR) repeat protein
MDSLIICYLQQTKYKEAEALLKQLIELREMSVGPVHPDVAACLHYLAEIMRHDGRYELSEKNYKRAIDIRTHSLGPNHPDVAHSLEGYAHLLAATYREAEADHMRICAQAILNAPSS